MPSLTLPWESVTQTRTFTYEMGRVKTQTLPESGTTTFWYRGDGLLT